MNILVGYEYSGIVSAAFRAKGHDVTTCDLLPSDGKENCHYQGDIKNLLSFPWDMAIFFPPCTYLCNAQLWMCQRSPERMQLQKEAIKTVTGLFSMDNIPKIAIENPKGILSSSFLPASQIIYPWNFGDPYKKPTCLWLKNLPPLISTCYSVIRKPISNHVNSRMTQAQKSKIRSKFFPGVAAAMANQWG